MEVNIASNGATPEPDGEAAPRKAQNSFFVVGLGASAGGIKAFKTFFENTPADTGMAFVCVLHLSPDFESRLAEVIGFSTKMPITQVKGRVRVEPDHVYVISPRSKLEMEDGHLVESAFEHLQERRTPIDIFFRTLAQAYDRRAVAVILSGTGADGSVGIKQIKELDGVVLAQDPAEAEYDQMPRNTIATGLTDYVLPVAEMPARIVEYKRQAEQFPLPAPDAERPADLEASLRDIFTLLRVRTGHDFANYKRSTLSRRIERRMNVHAVTDLSRYAAFLRDNPAETLALLKDLLISVTNFFRDDTAWQALRERIVPRLFEGKTEGDPVRVWVAGCATGEEAYTLAMLLSEHQENTVGGPEIQVFATDIDEDAIATARDGFYSETAAADIPPEYLRRFFNKENNGFRVRKEIRGKVLFAHHNLLKDPPFSHLDLVSCRNVLIYFNRKAQHQAMQTFHFALRPNGFLLLGASESPDGTGDLVSVVDKDHRIFQARAVGRAALPIPPVDAAGRASPARASASLERPASERVSFGDLHQKMLEAYAPPSLVVNEDYELVHLSEGAGKYLQFAGGEPSNNLLRVARPELRSELRAALYQAKQNRDGVEVRDLLVHFSERVERVNLLVRPALAEDEAARGFFLVLFEPAAASDDTSPTGTVRETDNAGSVARHLEEELGQAKTQLRTTVEQYETSTEELRASNEEMQAVNEELRSTAEELETSKEELQSINEELRTVNQDLKNKIDELSQSNNDLQNLMASTAIGTVFLDRALRVKLFTPRAADLFNLLPTDAGRPLSHITNHLVHDTLLADAQTVLDTLQTLEREAETRDGLSFLMRALPYRTVGDRIEGVVLTFTDVTGRRQADQRLRRSEERLRLLVESATDYAIITLDPERRVSLWNPGAQRLFGHTEAEIVGQPDDVLFTPEDRDHGEPAREADTALAEGRAADERWHLRKNGTRFYASGVMTPLRNEVGAPLGFVKIARDLPERKRAEEALRESEAQFRAMFEQAHVGIVQLSSDGHILVANPGFCNLIGCSEDEARRLTLGDVTHPEDQETEIELTRRLMAGEIPGFSLEKRYVRKSGSVVWGNMTATLVRRESGEPFYVLAIIEDIDERKRAEEALRRNEERFRALIDKGTDVITISDRDGVIRFATRSIETVCGYTPEEFVGRDPFAAGDFHPNDRALCETTLRELLERPGHSLTIEHRYRHKTGTWRWLEGTFTSLFHEPAVEGLVANFRDITERKQAEEALRQSEDRLRTVVASTPVILFALDAEGVFTLSDGRGLGVLDLQPGEVVGRSVFAVYAHVPEIPNDIRRVLNGETFVGVRRVGDFVFETWYAPLRDETGRVNGVIGVGTNITEREQAEKELRQSEERFRVAAQSASDLIYEWDIASGRWEWFGDIDTRLGHKPGALERTLGAWENLLHADDRDRVLAAVTRHLETGAPYAVEYRVHAKDGRVHFWTDRATALRDEAGNPYKWIGVNTDITERKQAEQAIEQARDALEGRVTERTRELAQANRAREELLRQLVSAQEEERRRISRELHDEMGQQLTGLLLGLKSLEDASHGRPTTLQLLAQLRNIAGDIGRELHRLASELRPTALDDLGLRAALANYVEVWGERAGIKADFHTASLDDARLPTAIETTIYRIVQEALTNVRKHAQARQVSVIVERQGGHVVAIVEDDGVGFDADAPPNGGPEGRLGLLGMRERASLAGGSLAIESAPGSGTAVFVRIPLPKEPPERGDAQRNQA